MFDAREQVAAVGIGVAGKGEGVAWKEGGAIAVAANFECRGRRFFRAAACALPRRVEQRRQVVGAIAAVRGDVVVVRCQSGAVLAHLEVRVEVAAQPVNRAADRHRFEHRSRRLDRACRQLEVVVPDGDALPA